MELNTSKQEKFTADSHKARFCTLTVLLLDMQVFLCHTAGMYFLPTISD
jgi:hypothetical protein